jgi:RNA polymerase sigma-54 factor
MDKKLKKNINEKLKNELAENIYYQKTLKILELSTLDLKEKIDKEIEENPFIEIEYSKTNKNIYFFKKILEKKSFFNHLINQAKVIFENKTDLIIAENIIGNLDDNGFFNENIIDLEKKLNISKQKILSILKVIKTFDPIGVGAIDLKESLLLQIEDPKKIEYKIIKNFFEEIKKNNLKKIEEKLKIKSSEIKKTILEIFKKYSLSPKKNFFLNDDYINQIYPDIIIKKENKNFYIKINDDLINFFEINKKYKNIKEAKNYIKNAKHLIKSLLNRRKILLDLSFYLIKKQSEFLKNCENLKNIDLNAASKDLNLDVSIIEKAIKNKYIQTPVGIFQLKIFFQSYFRITKGI